MLTYKEASARYNVAVVDIIFALKSWGMRTSYTRSEKPILEETLLPKVVAWLQINVYADKTHITLSEVDEKLNSFRTTTTERLEKLDIKIVFKRFQSTKDLPQRSITKESLKIILSKYKDSYEGRAYPFREIKKLLNKDNKTINKWCEKLGVEYRRRVFDNKYNRMEKYLTERDFKKLRKHFTK